METIGSRSVPFDVGNMRTPLIFSGIRTTETLSFSRTIQIMDQIMRTLGAISETLSKMLNFRRKGRRPKVHDAIDKTYGTTLHVRIWRTGSKSDTSSLTHLITHSVSHE
jgi:hypothetical protein